MKKMMLTLTLLVGVPMALSAEVSKEELKKLAAAGISDSVILTYVKSHGPMAKLSPEDVIDLKKAGLTDGLLAAILSPSGQAVKAAPAADAPASADAVVPPASRHVRLRP